MDVAEANRIQRERCKAEVARIRKAGERYHNGRLVDSLSLQELRMLQAQMARIYNIGAATDRRTLAHGRKPDTKQWPYVRLEASA